MKEYTSPGEVAVGIDENLTRPLFAAALATPDRPALAYRDGDRFVEWSSRRFRDEVVALAKGLIGLGIGPGQAFCIHSATRLEWTLLDYAIWAVGGVTVPIYETSSADQVEWIVSDSGAVGAAIESAALKATFDKVAGSLPECRHTFVIDEGGLDLIKAAGASVTDDEVEARAAAVTGEDTATIVYTSGTTGRPKGCVITHYNFLWDVAQVEVAVRVLMQPGQRTLLFLPLAHIFARAIQVACVKGGVVMGYATGIPQLVEELSLFKPTFLLAVPRVFQKVYDGARKKAHDHGKGKIFDKAAAVAEQYSRQRQAGGVKFGVKALHGVFDKLVYAKVRAALGGEARYAVSGGAALGEQLGHFFSGIGVVVLEGYGLTETTAGSTLNRPDDYRIGTVGRPVPGLSVRIADDGEILLKGGSIFRGYHQAEEATRAVLDAGGWLRTGDVGHLDDGGFLRITDRKKEIIVTSGGKNVAPAPLEARLRAHPLVSQSVVIGDGQPFIAALLTLDPDAFAGWAAANGRAGAALTELAADPALMAEIQRAVDDANAGVSKAESIRAFRILPHDFEVGEELSQKMSVKRHVVSEKYRHVTEEIYKGSSS